MKTLLMALPLALALTACGPSNNDAGRRFHEAFFADRDAEALEILKEPGMAYHVDEDGFSLLHDSLFGLDVELLQAVLEDGHPVNPRTDGGFTPLDLVAQMMFDGSESDGRVLEEMAQVLVQHGAEGDEWDALLEFQAETAAAYERTVAEIQARTQADYDRSMDPLAIERAAFELMYGR